MLTYSDDEVKCEASQTQNVGETSITISGFASAIDASTVILCVVVLVQNFTWCATAERYIKARHTHQMESVEQKLLLRVMRFS